MLIASPPCFVFLGLTFTNNGKSTIPVTIAVPIEIFFISFSVSDVKPSTEFEIDLKSFGFVTFKMIWVVACEMQFLSTLEGLCDIMQLCVINELAKKL